MSLDLYKDEIQQATMGAPGYTQREPTAFDGFLRGTGSAVMQQFARTASGLGMAAIAPAVAADYLTGGSEISDRLFRMHEEYLGNAVDYWTPKPEEVGVAGQIVGTLLGTLPQLLSMPPAFLLGSGMETARELVAGGVDPTKAAIGAAAQAGGLGLGLYVPIFGTTLPLRMLVGGAGFNVLQGSAMRGAVALAAEGSPLEGKIDVLDPTEVTLDFLMGLAFGGAAQFIPSWRTEGAKFWRSMLGQQWGQVIGKEGVEALASLRMSQHLQADTMPGRPVDPVDLETHVARMRRGLDQALRDEPIDLDDMRAPATEPDPARVASMVVDSRELMKAADQARVDMDLGRQDPGQIVPRTLRPGEIERAPPGSLDPDQLAVEQRAVDALSADPEGFVNRYLEANGKIVNTDEARKLFDEYNASPETRARHSASVHEASSWISKAAYARLLSGPLKPGEEPVVVFTAGGTGAGKSTATDGNQFASEIQAKARAIFDTNLSGFDSGVKKIDQALAADPDNIVVITYVHVDPVDASGRAALRAANPKSPSYGRAVPIKDHVETHVGANQVIRQMALHYADNPRVQVTVLDNRVPLGDPVPHMNLRDLPALEYHTLEAEAISRLTELLKNGEIPDYIYDGFVGGVGHSALAARSASPGLGEQGLPEPGSQVVASRRSQERRAAATPPEGNLRIFRVGSSGGLAARNAGDLQAVALHLVRLDDFEAPQPQGAHRSDTVTVYDVPEQAQYGHYVAYSGGRAENPEREHNLVGRSDNGKRGVSYSFPKGLEAAPVLRIKIPEIRAKLKELSGFDNFDDAGGNLTREAIEAVIAEKVPNGPPTPAPRVSPPPPPADEGRAAPAAPEGQVLTPRLEEPAAAPDPLALEAERWVAENPEATIVMGYDNNGEPQVVRVSDYLAQVNENVRQAQNDSQLFEIASKCLLGA